MYIAYVVRLKIYTRLNVMHYVNGQIFCLNNIMVFVVLFIILKLCNTLFLIVIQIVMRIMTEHNVK